MEATNPEREFGVRMAVRNRVLEATLANPPDNRLTTDVLHGLDQVMDRFEADDVDLLIIQGSKNSFSKGVDLTALSANPTPAELRKLLVLSNALFSRIARSAKPTVAAISGACLGGGFELALACHFRLCSDRARLGLPEVWIKLVPGLGGVYRLAKLVGPAKALEMTALGDLIGPQEALRLNIVNRVFPRDDFSDRVVSFVKALLMAEPRVIQEAIRLVSCCNTLGEEDCIRQGLESFARLAATWTSPT